MFSDLSFFWLILIIILSVLEMATTQLVAIWFVLAAIVSLVVSLFCDSFIVQAIVFILATVVFLIITRPFVKRALQFEKEDTNLGRYIGKKAIVSEFIDNDAGTGQINLSGITWSAKSVDGQTLEKGAVVIIKAIEGNKLLVEKI